MSTISTGLPNTQLFQAVQPSPQANAPSITAQQTSGSGTKTPTESLTYKNADGSFGPKHTLRSPAAVNAPTESQDAVGVNVKV